MGKKIIHDGPINTAVVAWMRGQGIKPKDVRGYTLTYDAGNLMTIDIRMIMEDVAPVEVAPANPPFVVDGAGDMWKYDAPRDGYAFEPGGAIRSLDYIRERYGIADMECPKVWPARVRDGEGDVFAHQGDGVYHMVRGCGAEYTLDEIGEHSVIEE